MAQTPSSRLKYGARPCPPWAYGVRVVPAIPDRINEASAHSPSWAGSCIGTTQIPDEATLTDWAYYVVRAIGAGGDAHNGWAPHRSSWVEWDGAPLSEGLRRQVYNKSADLGRYGLHYYPDCDGNLSVGASVSMMTQLFSTWKLKVRQATAEWAAAMEDDAEKSCFIAKVMNAMDRADDEFLEVVRAAHRVEPDT